MIAAGIGDDSAPALVLGKRGNLVVSAAQLEGADGLQVLELEEELAGVSVVGPLQKRSADGNTVEASAGGNDVGKRDHVKTVALISVTELLGNTLEHQVPSASTTLKLDTNTKKRAERPPVARRQLYFSIASRMSSAAGRLTLQVLPGPIPQNCNPDEEQWILRFEPN